MAYTLILDKRLLASGQQENVIVLTDTSGTTTRETAIAIDFSDYYRRIAVAFETMATNSNVIVQKLTSIEDHLNTQGTANNLANSIVNIDDHLDTQGTANNLANSIVNIDDHLDTQGTLANLARSIVNIDDHLDTQGTANNLARSIVNIDDHLDTQGTANNLARSIVNIDDHLDVNYYNNLAGKISNIESHLNSFDSIYQLNLSSTNGIFLENEIVQDSNLNTARVVKHFENTLIIDSINSSFTGSTVTGTTSNSTATIIDKIFVKNLGREITEFNQQEDVYRIILNHGGTTQTRTLTYNRNTSGGTLTISSPGGITIDEKDVLTLRSINTGFSNDAETLFITRTQNPTNLADEAIESDNISGQGTRNIVWNTTYVDAGTYYWFTSSRSRSGSIVINYKGFNVDEKIQGINGGIGYVRSYIPISEVDLRIIDIQAIFKDFSVSENVTSLFNNNSASIADIIKLNAGSGRFSTSSQSPSEAFAIAALYKLYVEDGEILNTAQAISPAEQQLALRKINDLVKKSGNV